LRPPEPWSRGFLGRGRPHTAHGFRTEGSVRRAAICSGGQSRWLWPILHRQSATAGQPASIAVRAITSSKTSAYPSLGHNLGCWEAMSGWVMPCAGACTGRCEANVQRIYVRQRRPETARERRPLAEVPDYLAGVSLAGLLLGRASFYPRLPRSASSPLIQRVNGRTAVLGVFGCAERAASTRSSAPRIRSTFCRLYRRAELSDLCPISSMAVKRSTPFKSRVS